MQKGIFKDTAPEFQPEGTTPFMSNWNHSKTDNAITVEEANESIANLTTDFVPIGKIVLNSGRAIIFSRSIYDNFEPNCEIGIIDSTGYTTIVADNQLNFKLTNQIQGEFKINIRGEEIIYFTDNLNPVRYLNLTTLNNAVNTVKAITDIDQFRLFPIFNASNIQLVSVNDTGGVLKSGVYYVSYAYVDLDGNNTNFLNVSNQISVTKALKGIATQNVAYGLYDGVDANTTTTKSFTIAINNLDSSYQTIRVAIIQVINGTPSVSYIDYPIISSSVNFTFTGNETVTIGSLADITVDRASYKTAKAVTQYNAQLYLGNLKGQKSLDYQKYANNIKINYVEKTTELNILREGGTSINSTDKNEVIIYDQLGFMDDEVYAMYIAFLLKDGSWSRAFHIPGREATTLNGAMHGLGNPTLSTDTTTVAQVIANEQLPGGNYGLPSCKSYLDGGNYINGTQEAKFYQVYNTAGANGLMGYWENENETYPDNADWDIWNSTGQIGSLRNSNVRHHKFPNPANPFCVIPYYTRPTSTNAQGRVLGIKLSDIYIPDFIKNEVQGYGVFYAQRDANNSLVLSQGAPIFAPITVTTAGVIGMNRLNVSVSDFNVPANLGADIFQFSGFDLMIDNTRANSPTFMKNEFTLNAPITVFATGTSGSANRFTSYTESIYSSNQNTRSDYVRQIIARTMIPHNSINNPVAAQGFTYTVLNEFGQKYGLYQIAPTNLTLTVPTIANTLPHTDHTTCPGYITNIYQYKQDLFNQFDQQLLRFTGTIISDLDSPTSQDVYGGDTSYNSYGFRGTGLPLGLGGRQVRCVNYVALKSYYHAGYRQNGPDLTTANEQDFYYPKQEISQVLDLQAWAEEKFIVNKDYSLGNYLNPVLPKDKSILSADEDFSNRVVRSEKDNPESQIDNYRIFLALNYKDVPRDKGAIWRLETFNNVLLIHNLRALRRTIGSENIRTDSISATLGSGNIFDIDPKELIQTKEGYGGTDCQWSGMVTPYGYFFTDIDSGNVFLLGDGLDTISNYGMMNYFKDNFKSTLQSELTTLGFTYNNIDNPNSPYGTGISSFYDPKYKRIIICKKDFSLLTSVTQVDYTASFGTYTANQLLYGDNKFYKVEFLRTNTVDTTKQIITDSLGPFSQVLTQVSLTDTEYFKDLSFTISYYPEKKQWGSFYDFKPNFMYNDTKYSYSSIYDEIYRHNQEYNYCIFYGTQYNSVVDVVSNDGLDQKTYGSISWVSKSDSLGVEIMLDTFNQAIIYNSNQCSGIVTLTNLDTMRRAENQWNFNKFRDISIPNTNFFIDGEFNPLSVDPNKSWYEKRKFQDRYLIARLIYFNNNQNKFVVLSADSEYRRISPR